jgi:ribose-phosphate pyrophosphokinase
LPPEDHQTQAMKLFAMNASRTLGEAIAAELGCALEPHEEREFAFGEHKTRPLVDVGAEETCVVSSLHGDRHQSVNDKVCRLLFFTGALKDAGAEKVTALVPYLAYSRKDRRTKPRDPVTTRYLAAALQGAGVDRVITMDVHNSAAFENSFRCPTINISTLDLFARYFYRTLGGSVDSLVAPDFGAVKTSRRFVEAYETLSGKKLSLAVMDKRRSEGRLSGTGLIGEVGRSVLILDDMIGSGATLQRSAAACLDAGARAVSVGATHGLFEGGAPALFSQPGIEGIAVTDSVALDELDLPEGCRSRITTLGTAALLADALRGVPHDGL